jgi:hypothetical protein
MTTFTAMPTEFEIYDDTSTLAVKVSMFDEGGATVEIKTCMDRTSFDLLVPHIQRALSEMKLTGDV